MRDYEAIAKTAVGISSDVPIVRPSTQNRLQRRKEELEKELKAVTEAINLFSKYPEISDALDLLSQIRI